MELHKKLGCIHSLPSFLSSTQDITQELGGGIQLETIK